jgi:PPM family protein phosphatase
MPIQEPRSTIDDSTGEHQLIADSHPPRVAIKFGALTDPGKVRGNNEDHFLVARLSKSMRVCKTSLPGEGETQFSEEEGYLIVVADGMGGAAAGERASALAVGSIEGFVLNTLKWFLHMSGDDEHQLMTELRQSLESADRTVIERARSNRAFYGMGTTLTMAFSVATDLFIVHAGDSRAYLFREGELEQLTNDHTVVQVLVDAGVISPEDAKHHKRRHVVTNVVGGPGEGVSAEIHKLNLLDGDTVLYCTDGLTEPVDDHAIAEILRDQPDPEDACTRLVELALSRGAPDNVTAVVVRYDVDR